MRVSVPELADAQQVLAPDDVAGPQETDQVEAEQLSRLVELGVLDLGQVELPVDLRPLRRDLESLAQG